MFSTFDDARTYVQENAFQMIDLKFSSFICSAFEADTKNPFARDPRNIAIRAEEFLRETGVADESRWGPEYEFYVFDDVAFENEVNRASYRVDSIEADWQFCSP